MLNLVKMRCVCRRRRRRAAVRAAEGEAEVRVDVGDRRDGDARLPRAPPRHLRGRARRAQGPQLRGDTPTRNTHHTQTIHNTRTTRTIHPTPLITLV